MERVAVIGAGSWGTAVASICARNAPTTLWARDPALAGEIDATHSNSRYLAGFELPAELHSTSSLEDALGRADAVIMGVPSHGFRAVLVSAAPHISPGVPIVSLTKGVEQGTLARMTEVVRAVLPGHPAGVLTGPNLAKEIMAGQPAASVIAMQDEALATGLQQLLLGHAFRVYTNTDVVGCEVAGALKNVIAIAAGMVDGMGFGDNTRAALITRGVAELTRLGTKMGGQPLTFAGLAGIGDLIATCISPQSRNRGVGEQLGRGKSLDEIITATSMVAEGVKSCRPLLELASGLGVDMPIVEQVVHVVHEGKTARDAVEALLSRRARPEHYS